MASLVRTEKDLLADTVANLLRYREDPVAFVDEILLGPHDARPRREDGEVQQIYDYQARVLADCVHNPRVALRSGHGVGKTCVVAWIVIWFIFTHGPSCKVVSTAPTARQVEDALWSEIRRWLGEDARDRLEQYLGLARKWYDVFATRINVGKGDWFATGETSDDPVKMEGYHAEYVLYVFDEAKGIPDPTYVSAEGALTTGNTRWILISTPGDPIGYFYDVHKGRKLGWSLHHVSGEDSPNVSKEWVAAREEEWGRESPVFRARVLGQFSDQGEATLIPLSKIEIACGLERREGPVPVGRGDDPLILGHDVARFGGDRSVTVLRQGAEVLNMWNFGMMDVVDTAEHIAHVIKDHDPDKIYIDESGVGAGVVDVLRRQGFRCDGINPGRQAANKRRYANIRAEMFWNMARFFKDEAIVIPNHPKLVSELSAIEYKYRMNDQLLLESKDDMKKRGLDSPDFADALAMTFVNEHALRRNTAQTASPWIEADDQENGHWFGGNDPRYLDTDAADHVEVW